ncbi:MAG: helix-turn-helix transcriptional regulator [Patescibacteria group bacterium]
MTKLQFNYYARIERGEENPSFEVLKGLSVALKVKSSEILPF